MIKPNHNPWINTFFRWYIHRILRKNFHTIIITGDTCGEESPVLLVGNHFSWWDGFFAFYLNNRVLKKRFHVMMLEEQLRKFWFFRSIGAFSVQPSSRKMLDSLHFASKLLENQDNMLVIYPQGKIESIYSFPARFGKGVVHILKGVKGKVPEVLFYVALVDYFSHKKPTLNLYLRQYPLPVNLNIQAMELAYNDFYKACITLQKE